MQLGCRDLTVGYDGKAILKNINFSVEEGEYLSIVGENGSGKSTLMRTLLRLQQPLSGEVILGNGLHREEIGYLPQQTVIQKDPCTKGFSRIRERNCSLRMSEPLWAETIL